MKIKAAVLMELGKPLELVELDVPVLKPGQVLVKVNYSSICHTQILECQGNRGEDRYLPHCLGHEGSGVVREIGSEVVKVKPGDNVILSWIKGSGADVPGTTYTLRNPGSGWDGSDSSSSESSSSVNAGAITTFSDYSVVSENRLTVVSDSVEPELVTLLGCTIPTGVGAVLNTARPRPGQSLAVFGVGGIGLYAINGAKIANCTPIIAVDILQDKLKLAKTMGADHCIDATKVNPVWAIQNICSGGVDFAIESSGQPEAMMQALSSVRDRGGTAVVVGNARDGECIYVDPHQLNQGKRLLGTWGGDNWPDQDYPRYIRLFDAGVLKVNLLMLKTYLLGKINEAMDDLEKGRTIRPLIDMKME